MGLPVRCPLDRGLLLAQKVLYQKHLAYGQDLKARRYVPRWAKDFEWRMQHYPPEWMREWQEIYKREKLESKLRRQTLSTAPRLVLGPQSPIEDWANDVLERRDTHYEYNPVLRIIEEQVYLPFLQAGIIVRFTHPRRIVNIPETWGGTDTREWWLHHLLSIMGTRDGYWDYRFATGAEIAPVRDLQPYPRATYGTPSKTDIARHLAECGVTDEEMADSFEWARAMLTWFITYRSRDQRYESPQARSWVQLLSDVQSPAVNWGTTPQGWDMYHPPHPNWDTQIATGRPSQMDPSVKDSSDTVLDSTNPPGGPEPSIRDRHGLDYAPPNQATDYRLDYGEGDEQPSVSLPPTEEMGPTNLPNV